VKRPIVRAFWASLVAAAVYEAAGVPVMTTTASHPRLTEEGAWLFWLPRNMRWEWFPPLKRLLALRDEVDRREHHGRSSDDEKPVGCAH
jgi:hypothetical protein